MRRELGELEDELARLRTLPEAKPKPARQSKKVKSKIERESRALQSELAKLENQIETRKKALGFRELTTREVQSSVQMFRIALGCASLGVAVFSVHLLLAARTHHVWTETTCAFAYRDGEAVASYEQHGRKLTFHPDGETFPATAHCFVPSPALDGIGRIDPPPTKHVRLVTKLSIGWTITTAILVLSGIFGLVFNRLDRQKRERGEIDPDDFASDS